MSLPVQLQAEKASETEMERAVRQAGRWGQTCATEGCGTWCGVNARGADWKRCAKCLRELAEVFWATMET